VSIRALIVDDEPLARLKLRDFSEEEDDVDIVGEASGGEEAVRAIKKKKPDLIFLDVQMPDLDGFGVIDTVGRDLQACVIFVTAYDQHALRAFEVHALDYLLKPFDQERFRKALNRARHILSLSRRAEDHRVRLHGLVKEIKKEISSVRRFSVQSKRKIVLVKADEVEWIEASGNYAVLHTRDGEHLLRESLQSLENKLDPEQYFRANRSAIINLEYIKEIQPYFHGEFVVILKNDQRIVVTRTHRANLVKMLGRS
jgi:two-component system LytT family response regulator